MTPRSRLGKLVSRVLTPRARKTAPPPLDVRMLSPRADAQRTAAYTPTLTAMMESQLRLRGASESPASSAPPSARYRPPLPRLAPPAAPTRADDDSGSDATSEADSDTSDLDGFADYARGLEQHGSGGSDATAAAELQPDLLPSPRALEIGHCTPRHTARDAQRAAADLDTFLQTCELPGSRQRLARLLMHADALGADALDGAPLACLGYERCAALLLPLLLPLPVAGRCGALAQLQSKLSSQLLAYLGTSLERVLESERGCQRFCRLPFEVGHWLLEHGPCDRGETLFDLANLWLEQRTVQQRAEASERQQAALAALPWRRPLAADFLRCMEANLDWAAQFVARSPLRPPRLPPSLDGRFSFTAEFELHDLLELRDAALAAGRPQQQQSPALYCGGYCWWGMLVANPRRNRFELYASCSPFSLFKEPFRASLHPAADVRFSFLGSTSLADWRMSHEERLAAMHTHWGGAAFWAPPNCPSLLAGGGALNRSPSGGVGSFGGRTPPALPMAAAARPDTARGPRPSASRQASRLSISSSASAELAGTPPTLPAASSGSMGGGASGPLPSARSSLGSGRKQQQSAVSGYEADSGAMTARRPPPAAAGLSELSMDQLIAEVRRSCPMAWGASLRVRINIRLRS
ncbi:hypothetical protein C2E20_0498 [Micractinium conductrix]|uniref:Uncharacterized protein n=1 Tax=Micractinium conductrix TaxID=554055 RepID=A0A2P6VR26_9CHLO|nr:hypothetical protein C2E20_0498 [Micractinium conductrix]|eukprot:PSC76534.1 hypothetical protein C2E20_0498 [Micractinium conductrix]